MKLHIRPATGLRIRDPRTRQLLPDEGARVPATTFWRRRLRDDDVVLVEEKPAVKKPPSKPRIPAPKES
jgi:hypothetical protein